MNLTFYIFFTFIVYSFAGWLIEGVYSLYSNGTFKKEGFFIGPVKPMYGIAMTILIICYEILKIGKIPLIILCFIIPTAVEYISGDLLKRIFNKIYWSYSDLNFNINGYICLKFSLYWCVLSYIGVVYINKLFSYIYIINSTLIDKVSVLMIFLYIVDLILSIMHCLKYRNI